MCVYTYISSAKAFIFYVLVLLALDENSWTTDDLQMISDIQCSLSLWCFEKILLSSDFTRWEHCVTELSIMELPV